jgi:hypothetical protein
MDQEVLDFGNCGWSTRNGWWNGKTFKELENVLKRSRVDSSLT